MMEDLKRLTEAGIDRFRDYLAELRAGGTGPPPRSLLADSETSAPVSFGRTVEKRSFDTRIEVAIYLSRILEGIPDLEDDVGLWAWLSLFYFDEVCPPKPLGPRFPGREYRHILEPGYPYGYRHLLGGAYLVYRLHGKRAFFLLCTKVHQESTIHHELTSRQSLISNPAVIEAARLLYEDPRSGKPKRGAQDPRRAPGSLLRFIDVLQQLDVNYDLYSMSPEALVRLLPREFDKWRRKRGFQWLSGGRNT